MALSGNSTRGTADPVDVEYLNLDSEDSPVGIHMHLDAVDGIARDVIEGFKALPRRGVEVGGLLLGKVIGSSHADVWIERYQRIECEHRFGPQFALDTQDHVELEHAAQRIAASTDLAVVGLYRSHTRSGFQLEDSDLELIGRYFSDPSDLVLLIRPENSRELSARFFARDAEGAMQPVGDPFPFRGRVLGTSGAMLLAGDAAASPEQVSGEDADAEDGDDAAAESTRATEATRQTEPARPAAPPVSENREKAADPVAASPAPPRERMRRLVPDFAPAAEPVEPGGVFSFDVPSRRDGRFQNAGLQGSVPRFSIEPDPETEPSAWRRFALKWWPLAGAIVLVCAAMWVLLGQNRSAPSTDAPAATPAPEEYRPVGMYVDPGAPRWRISWNPSATAFTHARSVALFVHDGDAEDHVDLTRQDVQQGTYSWQPKGNDVTFRLEAIDAAGRISAESFRVIRSAPAAPAVTAPAITAPPRPAPKPEAPSHIAPARATHKVPPVVPASIRPRIRGVIPIDVRVHIDTRGRVVSAAPSSRPASGLNSYLASRAVYAARLWRFLPARENGKPVASTQTIHFVFEK